MKPASHIFLSCISALSLLTACTPTTPVPLPNDICELTLPTIGSIQGADSRSPAEGAEVTVRAVVTAVLPGEGFFIHDPIGDADPTTSEGLWVADESTPFPGELWAWRGKIVEQETDKSGSETLTTLTQISGSQRCAEHLELPTAEFPLPSQQREALESMRVRLPHGLQVTQVPNRYQQYSLTVASERIFAPTEMVRPGPAAQALQRRFDAASMQVALPPGRYEYRVGDQLEAVAGVYDLRESAQIISAAAPQIKSSQGLPAAPSHTGDIRVVSMNLLNYFNGDGQGGGFPTPRGAKSQSEFDQQKQRIITAIQALNPDIIAVQELENDGDGPLSAAADLAQGLNMISGGEFWHWVRVENHSKPLDQQDVIRVGLFYRTDRVKPSGEAILLNEAPFDRLHRPVLAQHFTLSSQTPNESSADLLVASVHLKSKGSCPDEGPNSNQKDGQACWNQARKEAAEYLAQWFKTETDRVGTQSLGGIILGDYNSYRSEDPIRAISRLGLVELVGQHASPPLYSYVYRGSRGTLDYAFATPGLIPYLAQAVHWHVNADESDLQRKVHNEDENSPPWRRFSDHDPLIVDLRLSTH